MAITIAISGKGGSGKTTLSAMITRILLTQSKDAVLAVDADPNSCLGITLGVDPEITVAQIREQTRQKKPENSGIDRPRSLEYGIQQAITEAKGFDLLTMGTQEGPDCYCAVNNLLRSFMDKLSSTYPFVVVDNEAGMEHLSRRTTNNVDLLCIVAESSPVGLITAKRIFNLAKGLPISVKKIGVIWSRTETAKQLDGIDVFGCIPDDKNILNASINGQTIFDIDNNSPALLAVKKILEQKLNLT